MDKGESRHNSWTSDVHEKMIAAPWTLPEKFSNQMDPKFLLNVRDNRPEF